MLDRIIITVMLIGGLGLAWLGWQYYKVRTIQTIRPLETPNGKPNLLYFTGKYCSACKFQQTPIVEEISTKWGDAIAVKEYDVSDHPNLAGRYKVLTLPTTIIVNEAGQVTYVNHGVTGQNKLEAQLLSS